MPACRPRACLGGLAAVRREELVDGVDDDVTELVAERFAQAGEEIGGNQILVHFLRGLMFRGFENFSAGDDERGADDDLDNGVYNCCCHNTNSFKVKNLFLFG